MKNMIHTESISYQIEGQIYIGFIATPKKSGKIPTIMIAHAWKGLDDFTKEKAIALAELGYAAFAIDLYGEGKVASSNIEAASLMKPLFINRKLLQKRMLAAYNTLIAHSFADKTQIGAIGFCFGGASVVELLKSGASINGVVSFHGMLTDHFDGEKVIVTPFKYVEGKVLILHGYNDPLATQLDLSSFLASLSDVKINWQANIYGNTYHAFTNPEANDIQSGLLYNANANKQAWLSMRNFFEEIFI